MPTRKSLKTADSKLKTVEEKIGIGTWTWDLDTSELLWSPGLCRLLGVDPHTVVPSIDLYQSLVHPDDQIDFDVAVGLVSDKRLESRRFRVIRPDGSLRWLHSKAQPHFDRNGRTVMLMGVIQDVTEEVGLLSELAFEKQLTKAVTRLVDGNTWRAHPNGKLIETAGWTRLTGQSPQEAHDWDALAAIHPEDRKIFREAWREAIATRDEYAATIRVRTVGGDYVTRYSRALALKDATGSVLQWIGHSATGADLDTKPETRGFGSPQIRAARALLDWTGPELAARAAVSFSTVRRMEQCATAVRNDSLVRIRKTFEAAGIVFVEGKGGQIMVGYGQDPEPNPFRQGMMLANTIVQKGI